MSEPADLEGTRPLRSDALANRERVLAAAVSTMLRSGRSVPLAEIAREAGVGVGTLYRRYRNRSELLLDLERRAYGLLIAELDRIAAEPRTGLESAGAYFDVAIELGDQLVLPLHGAPPTDDPEVRALRRRLRDGIARIVDRGHRDRTLAPDVGIGDIAIFAAMLAQPLHTVQDWRIVAARQRDRFLRGISFHGSGPISDTPTPSPRHAAPGETEPDP